MIFFKKCDWVERSRFDRLGISYSHEENTRAFNFEDDVPQKIKKERSDLIMDLQSGISHELNQKIETLKVLLTELKVLILLAVVSLTHLM